MSLANIRGELKTVLEGVTGIGKVYDYLRYTKRQDSFFDLFKTSNSKIHAWQITRPATEEKSHNQNNSNLRRHNILIFGIYGLSDAAATEKTFQDLIESVCTALRTAGKQPSPLSGTALRMGPPQVNTVDYRRFGKVLSHGCDIKLCVDEYISF